MVCHRRAMLMSQKSYAYGMSLKSYADGDVIEELCRW